MNNRKAYTWPTPIDPEGWRCMRVYVPNDPLYIGQFWHAYEYFTKWMAWERDSDHTGSDVAAVWKPAFDAARTLFEAGEGCEMYELRTKPGDALTTQASTDGGDTWYDIFKACCTDVLIAPDTSTDEASADVSAAIIQKFIQWVAGQINDGLTAMDSKDTTVNSIMDTLSQYGAGASVRAWVNRAWDGLNADSGGRGDYVTDCPYLQLFEGLKNGFDAALGIGLNNASDIILSALDGLNDDIMVTLSKVAAAMGGGGLWNFVEGQGGAGGGAGFGSTCPMNVLVTFDTSTAEYSIVQGALSAGGNGGQCLHRTVEFDGTNWQSLCWIHASLPAGTVENVSFDWKATALSDSETVGIGFVIRASDDSVLHNGTTDFGAAGIRDTWTNRFCAVDAAWSVPAGAYIDFFIGQTRTTEADADACDIYLDNLLITGEL